MELVELVVEATQLVALYLAYLMTAVLLPILFKLEWPRFLTRLKGWATFLDSVWTVINVFTYAGIIAFVIFNVIQVCIWFGGM